MTTRIVEREAQIRRLTKQVENFDMGNPVHRAHYVALAAEYGELAAIMLVSQDVALNARHNGGGDLALTDPGEIASHPGWRKRNRVVRHGSVARYSIIDPEADTKVGGRVIPMFTRDQTVPAYTQED